MTVPAARWSWRRLRRTAVLPLRRTLLRRRLGRLVVEHVEGIPLVVLPDVFNPGVFESSDSVVRALRQTLPPVARGRVLDLGTGSGVNAIAAALLGYDVVAADINPAAVRCARMNAIMHRVEARMDVREGDLFAPVAGEQFDLVLFNPPFFAGVPSSDLDRAWRSVDVLERFGAGLDGVLAPGGRALVVVSSHGGEARTLSALEAGGFSVTPVLVTDLGYEVVTIVEARRTAPRA